MGTRNLTVVKIDGQYKVAQYGQWDGYPSGNGAKILDFLNNKMEEEKFKQALRNSRYLPSYEVQKIWTSFSATGASELTFSEYKALTEQYPELSRDTGADILAIIQEHPDGMGLTDNISFAADGLSCEWAWVIDFDTRTFEGYSNASHKPLTENDRFYFLRHLESNGYTCVHKVAEWSLDALPGEEAFLAAFDEEVMSE